MNNINQTINGLSNYIASQGGIPHLNRFAVEIPYPESMKVRYGDDERYKNVLKFLHFSARSVGLPSKSISTNAVLAAGPEQKYPYTDVYDDLTVTFMPTKGKGEFGLPERKFFEDWISTVVDQNNMLVGFSEGEGAYSVPLKLSVLSDQRGSPSRLVQYNFSRAYPIAISEIQFAAAAHELMIFKVTFSYDKINREDITNMPDNKDNPASVLPDQTLLGKPETPERPDRIWASDQFYAQPPKPKTPERPNRVKKPEPPKPKTPERPNRVKKPEPPKPKTPERKDRVEKWEAKKDDWTKSPIENKRVVGGHANTPTPKKLTKAVLGRVANRARAELGIRPMLDE